MLMSRLSTTTTTTECEDRARILKQNSQYEQIRSSDQSLIACFSVHQSFDVDQSLLSGLSQNTTHVLDQRFWILWLFEFVLNRY